MNIFDWFCIIWLAVAVILGLRFGFFYRLGNCVGLVLGIVLIQYYQPVMLNNISTDSATMREVITVLAVIAVCVTLSGLLAYVFNRIFKIISFIPFLKTANRILGGILSLVVHIILLALAAYAILSLTTYPVLVDTIEQSILGPMFGALGKLLLSTYVG